MLFFCIYLEFRHWACSTDVTGSIVPFLFGRFERNEIRRPQLNNNYQSRTAPVDELLCRYCKASGHLLKDCQIRAYNNSLKNEQLQPRQAQQFPYQNQSQRSYEYQNYQRNQNQSRNYSQNQQPQGYQNQPRNYSQVQQQEIYKNQPQQQLNQSQFQYQQPNRQQQLQNNQGNSKGLPRTSASQDITQNPPSRSTLPIR